MSWIEEGLEQDEIEDAREIAFFREHLSSVVSEQFTDDALHFILDSIAAYYAFSGILDQAPAGPDGQIDIDCEKIADYIIQQAEKELGTQLYRDGVVQIVMLDMDYNN